MRSVSLMRGKSFRTRGIRGAVSQRRRSVGIVLTSGHADFCVGADLDLIYALRDPAQVRAITTGLTTLFRRIETSGVTVVAAIKGAAMGGEIGRAPTRRT